MRYAVFLVALCVACRDTGTGALLHLEGAGTIDALAVTAHLPGGDVTRTATLGPTSLPTTYLAILPTLDATVEFDVTATLASQLVGSGSGSTHVTPHHVPSIDIELGGTGGDGGIPDASTPKLTVTHSGTATLSGVWVDGSDVWISAEASTDNLLHSSDAGQTWNTTTLATTALHAVFGVDGTIFAVGDGGSIFSGTTTFSMETNPAGTHDLRGLWGSSATDLYAVGDGSTILHRVAGGWVEQGAVGAASLAAIWGSDSTHVWCAGDGGLILSSNGNGVWSAVGSGTTQALHAIGGTSGADVWAAGDGGTVLHSTGGAFSAKTSGTTAALRAVSLDLAVGDAWTVLELPATAVATGLSGEGQLLAIDSGWAVGTGGTIVHP